jgi:hypothetical protein
VPTADVASAQKKATTSLVGTTTRTIRAIRTTITTHTFTTTWLGR